MTSQSLSSPVTQVTSPVPHREFPEQDLTLFDLVRFFWQNWRLICGLAIAFGLLTLGATVFLVPTAYEASATLVVMPPTFSSDLEPTTLSVQAYQRLIESPAVVQRTREKLLEEDLLTPADHLSVGSNLRTQIFVSRRREEMSLAPLVQVVAQGRSPEQAKQIANTWAQVFLDMNRSLTGGSTAASAEFLDAQFPRARQSLIEAEEGRVRMANEFEERLDDADLVWQRRISGHRQEAAQAEADHATETRRQLEEFRSDKGLENRKIELSALNNVYAELQREQARIGIELEQKRLELSELQRQLAETPKAFALKKAITDEALWEAIVKSGEGKQEWPLIEDRTLVTEQMNPAFNELSWRLSEVKTQVGVLEPRSEQLAKKLGELGNQIKTFESELRRDLAKLDEIERNRDASKEKLEEENSTRLLELSTKRNAAVGALQRQWDAETARLDRDIEQRSQLFSELAKNFNQAHLAKAQAEDVQEIRLAMPAVSPQEPLPRRALLKSILAALIGALLGLATAAVRQVIPALA